MATVYVNNKWNWMTEKMGIRPGARNGERAPATIAVHDEDS
jgi:hypothetical protein